ncbi:MAG: alpha/beta fold hydrolase [Candidatus Binataceae bacterium]
MERRDVVKSIAVAAAGVGLLTAGGASSADAAAKEASIAKAPFIVTRDGANLFYKDWGRGKPVVPLAAWCLNSDAWDYQTNYLTEKGLRCVAYDRRGHGRSSQPGGGYDDDTLAADLAAVIDQLDLHEVTLVGHSMGACEVVRYLTRHGQSRVTRIALVAPALPFLMKTADNPDGIDRANFERFRAALSKDFPGFLWANWPPFFVLATSHEMMAWAASLMLQCPLKVALDCNCTLTETDFRPELPKVTVPTLIIQGTADMSTPIDLTGRRAAKLIPGCELKVYEGAPHGLIFTHMDRLNPDLLEFIQG